MVIMETGTIVQLTAKYHANIVYHHFNNHNQSACLDDCRALFKEILTTCNKDERREILENLVKYDFKEEIKKMIE